MKFLLALLLGCLSLMHSLAQDTSLVLDTTAFDQDQQIYLASVNQWRYHPGHNPAWASPNLDTRDWLKRKLSDLSVKDVDQEGRVEGWFRLRLQLDSTFKGLPVWFRKSGWAAADLYVDGRLLASYGSTGTRGKPYQEYYFTNQPATPVELTSGKIHLIALHLVDYTSPFTPHKLKSQIGIAANASLRLTGPHYYRVTADAFPIIYLINGIEFAVGLTVTLLLWLLFWQKLGQNEKIMVQLLAIQSSLGTLPAAYTTLTFLGRGTFIGGALVELLAFLSAALLMAVLLRMVDHPWFRRSLLPLLVVPIVAYATDLVSSWVNVRLLLTLLVLSLLVLAMVYVLLAYRKRLQGAQWAIVSGLLFSLLCALAYVVVTINWPNILGKITLLSLLPSFVYALAIPLSFLVYVALRYTEILAEVRANASAVVQITLEKRQLLVTQNERLEEQVEARTAELKASQVQLIQKEKLASLGELTAGIAHEIQNPLNFVNNFSEVSTELIDELKEGPFQKLPDSEKEYAEEILGDLQQNLQKIHHHGGRASSIVKGMLEHSRASNGERQPTNLNALADEYLRLAYQGQRAKDKSFICELITDFDPELSQVEVVAGEIGRVLLNLFTNAFYAVRERSQQAGDDYKPRVSVSTRQCKGSIHIQVADNGTGMPEGVQQKIFQPFFTTKPTGEGTGLGLSLSYDIITQGHGGRLRVESQVSKGSTFTIELPHRQESVIHA